MTYSFLSDKNINYLQYRLRQIYPENKWSAIQMSVREAAMIWFKQHSEDLQLVYQQHGIKGLNEKFISDLIASAEYFDNSIPPPQQQDQLFDSEIGDPNIVADQPMPYVSGVENPIFTFAAFSRSFDRMGNPKTEYIYRQKPSYGAEDFMSHTLQGPGQRSGNNTKYSDYEGPMKPSNKSAYNITDRFSTTKLPMTDKKSKGFFSNLKDRLVSGFTAGDSKEDDEYGQDYGDTMKHNIYNTDQPKFFPNAYTGYKLGTMVNEYDPDSGSFIHYPNNLSTKTMKTLNQLSFGAVPVVTEMSQSEIAELGSRLYRQKDKPKRQRAPRQNGKCIPRQEYIELHDDYVTNQPRAKFHLDQIYNSPESRINTIMDPVMGKSALWRSQERSVLDIPCASMTGKQAAQSVDRYSRRTNYPDGTADSWAVPGCNSFNTEPQRQAYPTRDYVPAYYTTNYQLY
jgi:hypothetical protein